MRFAPWITKATDTHLEYVILIAFTRQQWSRERTSVLRINVHGCLLISAVRGETTVSRYNPAFVVSGFLFAVVRIAGRNEDFFRSPLHLPPRSGNLTFERYIRNADSIGQDFCLAGNHLFFYSIQKFLLKCSSRHCIWDWCFSLTVYKQVPNS